MLILDLVLIASATCLILTNRDVPQVFLDSIIGVSFAIAGVTRPEIG